jgi:hypothetical protein
MTRTEQRYRLTLLDVCPLTGRPTAGAILSRRDRGRWHAYLMPLFKTAAARDRWVAWARERYRVTD